MGTDHHPFDRLIGWVDSWLANGSQGAQGFVQYGTSSPPMVAGGRDYVSHDEMESLIANAGAIVCHGGPGTIIDCMRSGTKPIVVPRRHAFGEHVDDHQVRFARRLEAAGYIKVADDERELAMLLRTALDGSPDFIARETGDVVRDTVARFAGADRTTDAPRGRRSFPGSVHRRLGAERKHAPGPTPRPGEGSFSVGEMRDLWLRGVLENRRCGCGEPFDSCAFWTRGRSRSVRWLGCRHARTLHRLRTRYDRPWTLPILSVRRPWNPDLERYVDATARSTEPFGKCRGQMSSSTRRRSPRTPSSCVVSPTSTCASFTWCAIAGGSSIRGRNRSIGPTARRTDDRMIRYGAASAGGRYLLYNGSARLLRTARVPYLFSRYEDLVDDPQDELRRVLRFAGLPEATGFLEGGTARLLPNHTVDGNPMRFTSGPLVDQAGRRVANGDGHGRPPAGDDHHRPAPSAIRLRHARVIVVTKHSDVCARRVTDRSYFNRAFSSCRDRRCRRLISLSVDRSTFDLGLSVRHRSLKASP